MERVTYDPPSGWRYGFPKVYAPLAGETLVETLIRDGYPARLAEFGAQHCGFNGTTEALDALFPASAGAAKETTAPCVCHQGSVCGEACRRGVCHTGCGR